MKKIRRILACVLLFGVLFGMIGNEAKVSASGRAFKGKKNWLFYDAQGDGTTIYDYKGVNHYSKAGLKRVAQNLLAAKKKVNKKGAKFVAFFAPNKETIYSQYMPKRIKRKTTYTRYDQLYDYLVSKTDIQVAYPKSELIAKRNKYELYYPTDNHWNPKGQFIGVQELMYITDGKKMSIDDVKFKTIKKYYGDLNILSYGKYNFNCRNYRLKTKIKKENKSDKKILLVGDSFAGRMTKVAKHFYKKAKFCHINHFTMSKVKGYDYVVWEAVERYQDKFTRINFLKR